MLQRMKTCLCHPKLIGIYHKDSYLRAIVYCVLLFIVTMIISAVRTFNTDYFDVNDAKYIANIVLSERCEVEYSSETKKLTGKASKIEHEDIILDFLQNDNYAESKKFVLRFTETKVDVIYKGSIMGEYEYKGLNIKEFSLSSAYDGSMKDFINFQDVIASTFEKINPNYARLYFVNNMVIYFGYFLISLAISFIFATFMNPSITKGIRGVLCLYDMGIYFICISFSIMFNVSWLEYVAMVLPLLYTNITFSHIMRVEKRGPNL